jgi:saccharopine dehydrogenase (NAD+, L-lysine-forming)
VLEPEVHRVHSPAEEEVMTQPIVVFGAAGNVGRAVARHLRRSSPDTPLILGGRSAAPLEELAAELTASGTGAAVSVRVADAADQAAFRSCVRGAGLAIMAASSSAHVEGVIDALIEEGCDYLDVQIGAKKLERLRALHPRLEAAGRRALTEAGYSPGLPAVLARAALAPLEQPTRVHVVAGAFFDGTALVASVSTGDELVGALGGLGLDVYVDGVWRRASMLSDGMTVDLGPPLGVRKCGPSHQEELKELPALVPSLREVRHCSSAFNWVTMGIAFPAAIVGMAVAPGLLRRPLGKLLRWSFRFTRPPYYATMLARAWGTRDGSPAESIVQVGHEDSYEITAIPAVAVARQWAAGRILPLGTSLAGIVVDPGTFIDDCQLLGATVSRRLDAPAPE